jgi:predicted RNase H-like nuclease (RuvC/YqgF family)
MSAGIPVTPTGSQLRYSLASGGFHSYYGNAIVISGLALLGCCGACIVLLSALTTVPVPAKSAPVVPPKPIVLAQPDPDAAARRQRELELEASLREQIRQARERGSETSVASAAVTSQLEAANNEQDDLARRVEAARAAADKREQDHKLRSEALTAAEKRVQELEADLAEAQRRASDLQAQLEKAKMKALARLTGAGPDAGVFVECIRGAIVLLPEGKTIPLNELNGPAYMQALHRGHVQFVVLEDGFDSFSAARAVAKRIGVTYGYEPVARARLAEGGGG